MDIKKQAPINGDEEYRLYKMRWVILLMYVVSCACGNMQWMQYGIIGDVLILYYGISFEAVNWSSLVFLLCYVICLFPVSYILDKYGLRVSMILSVVGIAIGAWMKVASIAPERYWVLLLGQIVVSVSVVALMGIPPKLAAVWFGAHEVSSACGIGLAGIQLGFAIGFVVPPLVIRSQYDVAIIESDLFTIALGVAITCTVLVIIIILCFSDKPPTPPTYAASCTKHQDITFVQPFKKLMTNKPFVLLMSGFGIDLGIFCALSALLNQIILRNYPNGFLDAGRIGLLMVIAGIFGSLISGTILDKFKCYRGALLSLQTVTFLTLVIFTVILSMDIMLVYATVGLLGFYVGALWSVCFEVAVEITYPEPEGIAVGLLNGCGQGLGIIFTYIYSTLFYHFNDIWANSAMSALILLALISMGLIRMELRREAANFKKDTDNLGFNDVFCSKL